MTQTIKRMLSTRVPCGRLRERYWCGRTSLADTDHCAADMTPGRHYVYADDML